ncbi:CobW family GTP-binding protein [Acinetobacter soli]|uniref:CobW family GTP-binding protein n=1 Tax=Acinetobacter soli TaxID=487316 RepID=UPI001250A343|nr:GTP-binding protein [Acinetobacter soli]
MSKVKTVILTGFLGSGKTTLLNQLLLHPKCQKAAVLVNEFGEIGIDHQLLSFTSERIAIVSGGCICCSIREDIEEAVRHLYEQQKNDLIPSFEYLFIETSGLADPAPLIQTLMSSSLLREKLELVNVMTTVDAVLGYDTIQRHPEAAKQVALADIIRVTKQDLVEDEQKIQQLIQQIQAVNSGVQIMYASNTANLDNAIELLLKDIFLQRLKYQEVSTQSFFQSVHLLNTGIQTFSFTLGNAIDWTAFGVWLTSLLHRHGANILRVKGLLWVEQVSEGPLGFNAVQHMVFPPIHYPTWGKVEKISQLTFIVNGLPADVIERSFQIFMQIAGIRSLKHEGEKHVRPIGAGAVVNGHPVRRACSPRWLR